jgi:hypothetical protein
MAGYAIVVDGRIKAEFTTKEGAQTGAGDLKAAISDAAD